MEIQFTNLVIVAATAFLAPFLLGLVPAIRLPAVVLELVAGIAIGPAVLGWVEVDEPVAVLSTIGLAFLLFLAGLEIEFRKLRGRPLRQASLGYAASFGIALVVAFLLRAAGIVDTPLLVAIILTATSLGVVVPVLKDAGEISSAFGQLIVAAASIADFAAIFLLSLFFSREATGVGAKLVLIGGFVLTVVAIFVFVAGAERSMRFTEVLARLQDTTAQIRVRGAFLLLVGFAAIATQLGLEAILGAFAAGAVLTLLDRDQAMTHPQFRLKLEATGFGIFIPVFFVASGVRFDLDALTSSAATLARVPLFLAILLLVRGVPALLYRSTIGGRTTIVAALLQATSLPFIVAATQIGLELGKLNQATAAALVGAGILSVLLFPLLAVVLLKSEPSETLEAQPVG